MFIPISIDDFIKSYLKNNPEESASQIRESLNRAVDAKKSGAACNTCGQPIWAIGTATVGWYGCFTCITGESDNSEDYEIDAVGL